MSFHKVRRNRTNVMAMQNFMSGGSGSNNPGNNGSFNIDTGNRAGSGFRRTNSSSSFGHRAGEGGSGNGPGLGGVGGLWGDMFFARQRVEPGAPLHRRGESGGGSGSRSA